MPRGGWRGGGRPTREQAAEKARIFLEAIGADGDEIDVRAIYAKMIRDPHTSKTDRFRALELYAKLPVRASPHVPTASLQPLSVPRGTQFDEDGRLIWPETGKPVEPSEMKPVVPFEGTPPIDAPTIATAFERLEVTEAPDDGKVARLRPVYGRTLSNGRRLAAGPRDDDGDSAA